jgi:beta-ribofuranosylaminobenzene 5'-phosphate synthase
VDAVPRARPNTVRVRAPARLHFGFLDLNGGLGRRFGSLGLTIAEPALDLTIIAGATPDASDKEGERVSAATRAAAAHLNVSDRVQVLVNQAIPSHAGFGSGTQLHLAIAAGLAMLFGRPFALDAAAIALDRGNRSGVGLAAFKTGGFIVDGGRDQTDRPPPVLARNDFPTDWRVLLVLDDKIEGVHGKAETSAFRSLPPFPAEIAAHLCRVALMQVLPALAVKDFGAFGRGIAEIQRRVGDHFAPFQGGGRYTSPAVGAVLSELEASGVEGVGQSSWGPTGYALFASDTDAEYALRRLQPSWPSLRFLITGGRNSGAEIFHSTLGRGP